MSSEQAVGFYSFLRYVPDPLRDEGLNVGLVLVSEAGDWAKFRPHATKGRIRAIGRTEDVDAIKGWAASLAEAYGLDGPRGLLSQATLERNTLAEWAEGSSGMLRFSAPRVALARSMDDLWMSLWRRYIRRRAATAADSARAKADGPRLRPMTGGEERQELIASFVSEVSRVPNFDSAWIHKGVPFQGKKLAHVADVAIQNGSLKAVGQAIPLAHGSDIEVIERRALLVDAALDVERDVFAFGIYDDPPPDRLQLLQQTTAYLLDLPGSKAVRLFPRRSFGQAIESFAPTLLGRDSK